jgi:hypothetical protein
MDEKGAKQAGLRDKTHVERRPVLQALGAGRGPRSIRYFSGHHCSAAACTRYDQFESKQPR